MPPGGALLVSAPPRDVAKGCIGGPPPSACFYPSEDTEDARSPFPLSLVPSPHLHAPFLTVVLMLGGSEGPAHCLASIKKLCLPPTMASFLPGAFTKGHCLGTTFCCRWFLDARFRGSEGQGVAREQDPGVGGGHTGLWDFYRLSKLMYPGL